MFNEKLKQLRTERRLSQKALAQAIDFTQSNISEWEQGRIEPSIGAAIALCRFFEVSADYLLGLEDESGAKEYGVPAVPAISKDEREALELYRKLSPKDRQRINTALEMYADLAEHSKER